MTMHEIAARRAAITRELNDGIRDLKKRAAAKRAIVTRGPDRCSSASRKAWRTRRVGNG